MKLVGYSSFKRERTLPIVGSIIIADLVVRRQILDTAEEDGSILIDLVVDFVDDVKDYDLMGKLIDMSFHTFHVFIEQENSDA